MRSLALVLILLNLAFFYWHTVHREAPRLADPLTKVDVYPGAARLVLLSERGNGPAAAAASVALPELHCETVGPFDDRDRAESLRAALEAQGAVAGLRSVSREVVSAYWVLLPPRDSLEAAHAVAGSLGEQGIRDLYVITEGEHRAALSLGLFSEHERARRRVIELRALGHEPRIETRLRTRTVHWLDLAVPSDRIPDLEIPQGLGRMDRPCPHPHSTG